jgi:hypothetical protein
VAKQESKRNKAKSGGNAAAFPPKGPSVAEIKAKRQAALDAIAERHGEVDSTLGPDIKGYPTEQADGPISSLPNATNWRVKRALRQAAITEDLRRGRKKGATGAASVAALASRLVSAGVVAKMTPQKLWLYLCNHPPKGCSLDAWPGNGSWIRWPNGEKKSFKTFATAVAKAKAAAKIPK